MLEKLNDRKFEYKKLTEEEQKQRGILGRLIGVIADIKEPTRNGRKYSEALWENVFNNPIMQEKIRNRCCFGELNHPTDRTETDMEKVAICLAEQPKKGPDGKLYGVFDILSTPNGKILKALCDYGCNIGISSRGQGDLITDENGDEAVDPDTYDCECFDAVLVPGVESARLKYVTEGLNATTLRTALNESLQNANDNERKIMEETLKDLDINLNEAKKSKEDIEDETANVPEDIAENIDETEVTAEETPVEKEEESEGTDDIEAPSEEDQAENVEETAEETDEVTEVSDEGSEDAMPVETIENEIEAVMQKDGDGNIIEDSEFNAGLKKALEILKNEIPMEDVKDDEAETSEVEDQIDSTADEQSDEDIDNEEESDEADEDASEAIDNGSIVLVNSLKEALKNKSDLENNVKSLQEKLAVSDAKVNEVIDECNRYKSAIARLSLLAKTNKDLKESVSALQESLNNKEELLKSQQLRISRLAKSRKDSMDNSATLTESLNSKSGEITRLNESLASVKTDYEAKIATITEELRTKEVNSKSEITKLTEDLNKATSIKESYRKLANKAVNKYIEVKADILGLTPIDIKRKLGESYTMEDVDQVCEDLKSYQLNVSRLPFSIDRKVNVKVNESLNKSPLASKKPYDDDDVDDGLIKLANFNN